MKRRLRALLYAVGTLAAVITMLGLAGYLIPREHVASSQVTIPAPADTVWEVVRDLGGVPGWWSDMKSAEPVEGASRETWRYIDRFNSPMPLEVLEEGPYRLVLRIATEGGPFGGTWTYVAEPVGEGRTRVTVTEDGWISNPFFRVISRLILGYHATLDAYLAALGRRFGADVVPTHAS